jgi:hypothetical protein
MVIRDHEIVLTTPGLKMLSRDHGYASLRLDLWYHCLCMVTFQPLSSTTAISYVYVNVH